MAHTLVPPDRIKGKHFSIAGDEAHHLIRVMRRKAGDEVVLFDGVSRRYRAVLTHIDTQAPSAEGLITADLPAGSANVRFRLFQGIPKGTKFDFIIEKAVELGAIGIYPFVSERCQVKLDDERSHAKADRWKRVAEAAAKQCERPDIPMVSPVSSLEELEDELKGDLTLIFSLRADIPRLKEALQSEVFASHSGIINAVIGPESGLAPREEDRLVENGGILVSMGSLVLRAETAGLAALAILQHEFGGK